MAVTKGREKYNLKLAFKYENPVNERWPDLNGYNTSSPIDLELELLCVFLLRARVGFFYTNTNLWKEIDEISDMRKSKAKE